MRSNLENLLGPVCLLAAAFLGSESRSERAAAPAIVFASETSAASIGQRRTGYQGTLETLAERRGQFAKAWERSSSENERNAILAEARELLLTRMLGDLFPAWYGTTWDFNGVTQTPGEGKIACGYFVTTTLRDAGFDLPRVKLAQQPSQKFITTLADKKETKLLYDKPMAEIEKHLRDSGPGLYIVGLDRHTGFVVNDGRALAFIHSSYYDPPFAVTAEPIDGRNPLAKSKYRIFGKILGDEMIRKWILGEPFVMK